LRGPSKAMPRHLSARPQPLAGDVPWMRPYGFFAKLFQCTLLAVCLVMLVARQTRAQMNLSSPLMEMKDEIAPDQLPVPRKMTGIGTVHMDITATPQAQAWFNQGLNLLHDFWDYESAKAFEQALRVDPQCAMCYWGLYRAESYYHSTAPDYADISLEKAVSLEKRASKRERLYIEADAAYEAAIKKPSERQADLTESIALSRKLVRKYPRDTQARIFLALAVGFGSKEGVALLQDVIKEDPRNSAANHYLIHALEAGPHPEQALGSAEILPSLAPASGHMVHMPGHIYFRLGDYGRAERAFDASMHVDETYLQEQHVDVDDDWNYVHNLMYAVANLLEEGKLKKATEYSAKLTGARGELDSTLYPFSARDSISRLNPQLPVALRTGDWPQVIALSQANEAPASQPNLRFLARELATFGTGMQALEAHDLQRAQTSSLQFDAELWRATQQLQDAQSIKHGMPARANSAPKGPPKIPVKSDAYIKPLLRMLSVMSLELRGSLLLAQTQTAEAKAVFAEATRDEKALGYHEPPLYIRPVGETEAAALMAAGDFASARAAYQQALLERPRSGYPLYGIALCDEKAGDSEGAAKAYSDFLAAWKDADPDLPQISHARIYVAQHPSRARTQFSGSLGGFGGGGSSGGPFRRSSGL
jgi:tetratricopeptide (TPR) repeat protein